MNLFTKLFTLIIKTFQVLLIDKNIAERNRKRV